MKASAAETQTEFKGQIRLPVELATRVKAKAVAERRSMNSQIIVLLERALPENEKAETASAIPAE